MSHSRGAFHLARFCPWCGLERIERDYFDPAKRHHRVEFICTVCGVAFRISESARRQHANVLHAQERQQRTIPGPKDPVAVAKQREYHAKWKEFKAAGKTVTRDLMKRFVEERQQT